MTRLFTSESVTSGHPDKLCDQISDAILDAILHQDPQAHVAVETAVTTGQVHVMGEVSTSAYVEIPDIVRQTIARVGYVSSLQGFDAHSCGVNVAIGQQSPDIAAGVNTSLELREQASEILDGVTDVDELDAQGAGDQGMMFGYANRETDALYPLAPYLAHRLAEKLERDREYNPDSPLNPDGKTQVTLEVDSQGRPIAVDTVVVSTQHVRSISLAALRDYVRRHIVEATLDVHLDGRLPWKDANVIVNPAGEFIVGGPMGDAGLTGRKIIVDTYGGVARHGGGAFSGKDPSKVDRSAAYAMRWVAKNIVAARLAEKVEVQVAYAIGRAAPVGLYVDTFGTGVATDSVLADVVASVFDLRPAAIIRDLDLLVPGYTETAAYGHFGRSHTPRFTWERTDRVNELRDAMGA